ncbi:fimbrial protein [Serratia sp. L9]|uniref:fimbrial protein n=1 Tax=Serratia sp. L9 TaxID=3423946 RepID=UPI003D664332
MNIVIGVFGGLLLAMTSLSSWAAVTCSIKPGWPRTDTFQLSPPTISAGADIPNGTVIYQGRWVSGEADTGQFECLSPIADEAFWFNIALTLNSTPLPLSTWSGSPFGGAVYQTNIPGVGVAISRSNTADAAALGSPNYQFPQDYQRTLENGGYSARLLSRTLYISLIKIGPISPGSYTLNASSLPTAAITAVSGNSHPATAGLPIRLFNIELQGQLTISSQTCTTPDVAVELGTYEKRLYFKGINSTTPWIDSSISLTNCPTFHGFYNQDNSTLLFDYTTGTGSVANSTNNSIGVRLTPTTSVIDAANGIMAIDSTVAGAATGVGIQIGWGDRSQTPTVFNFASEQAMTLPKDGSPTIRVPLAARYIQTATDPTPGKANGKLIFTINYY